MRFLLNRVSGCVGEGGVSYVLSRGRRARVGLVSSARAAPPSVGVGGSHSESSRPARCVLGAVPRPALAAASRGGWRRRRRPGTRLAAAPRVRTASCAVHAALALSRALSDGVPRPRSNAKLRPLDVSPEIPSLRRSGYAMVTACALAARRAIGKLVEAAGPVSGSVQATRRDRSTAPSNKKTLAWSTSVFIAR